MVWSAPVHQQGGATRQLFLTIWLVSVIHYASIYRKLRPLYSQTEMKNGKLQSG